MKKFLKTIICCFLMSATLALTFACGGGSDESKGGSTGLIMNENRVYYIDPDVPGDSIDNKTRIKVTFAETGFGRTWIENAAKAFVTENREYWVYLDGDPEITTGMSNKLETGAAIADVYMVLASNWYDFAVKGWIEPIDDVYATKIDGENKPSIGEKTDEVFLDYSKATVKNKESLYVMPWNKNVTGIAYNGKMFEQYGWKVPETVTELVELCDRIIVDTKGKVSPFVYCGADGGYFDFLLMNWWLQASGKEKVEEFFDFGSEEVFAYKTQSDPSYGKLVGLNQFNKLFGKNASGTYNGKEYSYVLTGSGSKRNTQAQQSFLIGEAAMMPNGGWMECEMQEFLPDGFEIRMMRTPYVENVSLKKDGEYISCNYSAQPDYMLVPAKAKNKEGGKKFLAFLQRDDILKQYTKDTGSVRPFVYDYSEGEYTKFNADCFDICKNSDYSYFEYSKSPLWLATKVRVFNTLSPYTKIRSGELTAAVYCANEYNHVKDNWAKWKKEAGM